MDADFREIHALSCEKGWCAIRDEAEWQLRDDSKAFAEFVESYAALDGHCERAMVTFLDIRSSGRAQRYSATRTVCPTGASGRGFPICPHPCTRMAGKALADGISNYFHRTEGRGKNCVVETFRRGEHGLLLCLPGRLFAAERGMGGGEFARRPHNPAFEVIYVYSEKEGTLDLNFRGAYKAVEPLQAMFATEILKLSELPPDLDG